MYRILFWLLFFRHIFQHLCNENDRQFLSLWWGHIGQWQERTWCRDYNETVLVSFFLFTWNLTFYAFMLPTDSPYATPPSLVVIPFFLLFLWNSGVSRYFESSTHTQATVTIRRYNLWILLTAWFMTLLYGKKSFKAEDLSFHAAPGS